MNECTHNSYSRRRAKPGAAMRTVALVLAATVLAACSGLLDVKNPNNVVESALTVPGAATAIANGAGASVNRALNNALTSYGAVSDELTYVGSRDAYGYADDGEVSDPFNEFADAAFPNMAEARYTAFNAVRLLKGFDSKTPSQLADRNDLARSLLYEAVIFSAVGQIYDDFVIASEKTVPAKPLGEGAMAQVFDSAVAQATGALTIAQATTNLDIQIRALMVRAVAKHQKAIWAKLNGAGGQPVTTTTGVASPLVSDAGAVADASAALALIGAGVDYRYQMKVRPENVGFPNIGNDLNQRLELRMGDSQRGVPSSLCRDATCDQYVLPGAGGNTVTGIKYKDPITNAVDPVLASILPECCQRNAGNNQGDNIPITIASAREMLLILAEDRLAANDLPGFTARINLLRALNSGLTAYNGTTPAAIDLLKHSRFVNLFNQGRRLSDMHRFGIKAQKWRTNTEAYNKACYFPIMNIERSSHPADFVNPLCRP